MNSEGSLKFYTCRSNTDFGQPIIVLTSSNTKITDRIVSEYFLFFKKTHVFFGLQIFSNKFNILDEVVDLDFMIKEAKSYAQGKVDHYIYELNKDKNDTHYLFYDTNIKEDSFFNFILLVKSKEFYKEIATVRNKTKSSKLQGLIDNIIDADLDDKISLKDLLIE